MFDRSSLQSAQALPNARIQSSADVEKRILSKVRENAIILLHDEYASSIEAALFIVDELQNQGYVFVTVEEIMLVS